MKTSVAFCTYNGETFLNEQIDSILSQSISVDEIVVCDDGSTDSTIAILNTYKEKYPHIFKIHQNEANLRSVKNFEKAISLCENEIIFLSDQDDIWEKDKVKTILNFFEKNPEISVISTNAFIIDEHSLEIDKITIWDVPFYFGDNVEKPDYFYIINYVGNIATGATMAIRKNFLPMVFPFPGVKNYHHDEWLALIASFHKKYTHLRDKLIKYRIHTNQQVGGVSYDNTPEQKKKLIDHFSQEKENFVDYKRFLRKITSSYERNKMIFEKESKIALEIQGHIANEYFEARKNMVKKYPIRSFFLNIIDKISNKRQLNK